MRRTSLLSVIDYSMFSGPHNHDLRLRRALVKKGIETTVLLPDEPGDALARLRAAGLRVLTYRSHRDSRPRSETAMHAQYLMSLPRHIKSVRQIIRQTDIDLVQLADPFHPHAGIAAKLEGRPVVVHLVGMGGSLPTRTVGSLFTYWLADVIMTNGTHTLTAYPGMSRMRKHKISYFSPVDIETFKPDAVRRTEARAEFGLQSDDTAIGYIGRLNPEKDHLTCVRAIALIRKRFPQVRFIMMGGVDQSCADYVSSIWKTATALGLHPGRDIIHKDAGARVAELAQAFDVCWSMGYQEGATSSVGEAMALEIPVVGAGNSAVREMIEPGVSGFLVGIRQADELASVTSALLEHPALRIKIGRAARERAVKLFSTELCAARHLEAYEMALSGGRGQASVRRKSEQSLQDTDSAYTN